MPPNASQLLPQAPAGVSLWVGTSGYSYTDWVETGFYPEGTKSGQMLIHYARQFLATELNYTWYQLPKAEAIDRQRQKSPPEFLFAAKLTRTLTHEVDPRGWRQQATAYREGLAPLVQSRQLVAVLVQLPPSFDRSPANRQHLAALLDELEGLPLAVEFRNDSWVHDRVFEQLAARRITLAAVDEPNLPGLFPALEVVTNPAFFYVRFHGRNARGWRSGKMSQQFDYDYSDAELAEWVDGRLLKLARQARRGFIFFNNHVRAQAPKNARQLTRLLRQRGFDVIGAAG